MDDGRRALAKKERTSDGSGGVWMVPDGLGRLALDPSEIYILVLQIILWFGKVRKDSI